MTDPFNQLNQPLKTVDTNTTESQKFNFERMAITIIDPAVETNEKGESFISRSRSEFVNHIRRKYGNDFYLPGLEYQNYLVSLSSDQIPEELRHRLWYMLVGFPDDGLSHNVHFDTYSLVPRFYPVEENFSKNERVILLKK